MSLHRPQPYTALGTAWQPRTGSGEQGSGSGFVILSLSCEESCRTVGKILTLYTYEVRSAPHHFVQGDNTPFSLKPVTFFAVT